MSTLVALALSVVLWPPIAMFRAYLITIVWGWYVVPAFHIPAPSIYFLVGLTATLHLCLPLQRVPKNKDENPISTVIDGALLYGLLFPSTILFFAWIWRWLQWGVA
jgi:hypothetical protein